MDAQRGKYIDQSFKSWYPDWNVYSAQSLDHQRQPCGLPPGPRSLMYVCYRQVSLHGIFDISTHCQHQIFLVPNCGGLSVAAFHIFVFDNGFAQLDFIKLRNYDLNNALLHHHLLHPSSLPAPQPGARAPPNSSDLPPTVSSQQQLSRPASTEVHS